MRPSTVTLAAAMSLALLIALAAPPAAAHDIPNDVTVQVFFKPEGQLLRVMVRVPMRAMRDTIFPERAGGFMDLDRSDPLLGDAAKVWISDSLDVYEGERLLPKAALTAARVSLESERSFASYEEALAHVTGPKLASSVTVIWDQTLLDLLYEYPIRSDQSAFSIRPAFGRLGLRVVTGLRFLPPFSTGGGAVRAFEFTGDPGLVRLDPHWYQAAGLFVEMGFLHILDGTDHLLFLFCLVIPFRRFGSLVPIVTAFTVAHSMTLIASAYNFAPDALWFPPLIEMLIAASIVYMALENIVGVTTVHRRWMIAFGFGLVHGFGFSFALRETMQFAGTHLLASLLSFNVGVELGQLLVLLLMIPALEALFRFVVAERMGTIILSALVAHTGWHWMIDRWERFRQFRIAWPVFDAAWLASALRWAMVAVILAGLVWLVNVLARRRGDGVEGPMVPEPLSSEPPPRPSSRS
jgi:hypothetical protein